MKLNLSKLLSKLHQGNFLVLWFQQRGIKANPDMIQAILNIEPPKNIKDVQNLTRQVAAFNRFVSKTTDKCLPFFRVLRKVFEWTDECQQAFED